MTAIANTRAAVTTAIAAALPTTQVLSHPPGENQALKEAVWVDRGESIFEWRSLGASAQYQRNRTESITLTIRVQVYQEHPDQRVAADGAFQRCEALFALIETAIATDPTITAAVTFGLIAGWSIQLLAVESGWLADGTIRLEAQSYPQ